jgi:hypothetical protein
MHTEAALRKGRAAASEGVGDGKEVIAYTIEHDLESS